MPRMIDLIRASALPATRMHAAARGALTVPAAEMIEILVHLANHNKIFAQQAKLTLAGWDEASALAVAADANSPAEVLEYMISPQNLRPQLLPALLENHSVSAESIIRLATSGSRETIQTILKSKRCSESPSIQTALKENPNLRTAEAAVLAAAASADGSAIAASENNAPVPSEAAAEQSEGGNALSSENSMPAAPASPEDPANADDSQSDESASDEQSIGVAFADLPPDPEADETFAAFMTANATEIAAEEGTPFQAIGGIFDQLLPSDPEPVADAAPAELAVSSAQPGPAAAAAKAIAKKPHQQPEGKRDNTLQKINKLDVKDRIQLAIKGTKEERSILIRDGTKIVALAVLESPKISDGEVEHFASQKNVLEAVLRAIPMKRRFAKQHSVLRNLVFNPRTPLDVSLGLMKHLLVQDLRNLGSNKEVSETVRKLALKMFKQKTQTKAKD